MCHINIFTTLLHHSCLLEVGQNGADKAEVLPKTCDCEIVGYHVVPFGEGEKNLQSKVR